MFVNEEFSYDISPCTGRTNYRVLLGQVENPRVISDKSVGVLGLLVQGDQKYSENLRSDFEKQRSCHLMSTTSGCENTSMSIKQPTTLHLIARLFKTSIKHFL